MLYDGDVVIRHYESATRSAAEALLKHPENTAAFTARWKALIEAGDPFYDPHFASEGTSHMLRRNKPVPKQVAPRIGRAGLAKGPPAGGKSLAGLDESVSA